MPYKVINNFIDKETNSFYEVGEEYPKDNEEPTEKRIDELSKKHPKYRKIFIEEIESDLKDDGSDESFSESELKNMTKSEQEKIIIDLNGDPKSAKNEGERIKLILQLQTPVKQGE
ncbi:hypothetical protein [Cytobacillus sp. IB215316]|uniref:hypothetical protein n=1 Tax=Cytobacillus sp. IB215316 TaxID=3097354 RepID=UPI002A11A6B9|nr:hypothetical protein [Cytobacillus sp. IB215316]MDX8359821.1 hypothetical protein [Cytobacillus sp. IB215316]